jgi:hypothetical protein
VAIGCNPVYIEATSGANRRVMSEICGDGKQRALAAFSQSSYETWLDFEKLLERRGSCSIASRETYRLRRETATVRKSG